MSGREPSRVGVDAKRPAGAVQEVSAVLGDAKRKVGRCGVSAERQQRNKQKCYEYQKKSGPNLQN
jgi:hypothetical protein